FLAQVSDSADEVALPRFTQRKTLSALKYHFDHAARFRSLHAGERFFGRGLCSVSRDVQIHQRFVDLHSILDKRDLQFFALQSAATQSRRASKYRPWWKSSKAWYKSMSQGQTRFFSRPNMSRAFAKRSRAWTVFPCWP